jgi:hypothetical protein
MRRLNIIANNNSKLLEGFENLELNNIASIYSCSIDIIYCGIINLLDNQQLYPVLENLIDKIKPNGQLVLMVHDVKRLCKLYIDSHISESDFFHMIRSTNNSATIDDILKFLETKYFDIVDLKRDEWTNQLSAIKKSI